MEGDEADAGESLAAVGDFAQRRFGQMRHRLPQRLVLAIRQVHLALEGLEMDEVIGLGLDIDLVAMGAIGVEGEAEQAIVGNREAGEILTQQMQHVTAEAAEGDEHQRLVLEEACGRGGGIALHDLRRCNAHATRSRKRRCSAAEWPGCAGAAHSPTMPAC